VSEPRHAARPRAGPGPRAPTAARDAGASRQAGRRSASARASHEPAPAVAQLADSAAEPQPRASDERSSWQQLLDALNALLRDPTLSRALARSLARLTAGVRDLSVATRAAVRRLAHAVRRLRIPRLPRRVLLGLLALTLPLALLALLSSRDDGRPVPSARGQQPAAAAAAAAAGGAGGAVQMPHVRSAPAKVPRVRVALVLDRTYDPARLRRELRTLGAWLAANHAPGTRVAVIDARSARASRAARGADLAGARPERQRPSTAAAVRSAFGRRSTRRLLVTLGTAAAPSGTASTLRIAARRGAGSGRITPIGRGRRSRATIDDRRPNALAASVARAIMGISGQRERR
jgi:hypothetical protein